MSPDALWRPDEPTTARAASIAKDIAFHHSQAERDLVAYYTTDGNYAGATFANLGPKDPMRITPTDLLAVTALSVRIPPLAVRRLTSEGESAAEVERMLRALPADLDIRQGKEHVEAMSEFYELVKRNLRRSGTESSSAWVTASKICARMRPQLFPVRDSVVAHVLGLKGSYPDDWPVFSDLMRDEELTARVDDLVTSVAPREGIDVGDRTHTLKHLDVLLWMHGMRERKKSRPAPTQ